jgi:hypothetical protein
VTGLHTVTKAARFLAVTTSRPSPKEAQVNPYEQMRYDARKLAAAAIRNEGDQPFNRLVGIVKEQLAAHSSVHVTYHDAEAALKARMGVGRCRNHGGKGMAFWWPKGQTTLAKARCPVCDRPLSQTTLALQAPFTRLAPPHGLVLRPYGGQASQDHSPKEAPMKRKLYAAAPDGAIVTRTTHREYSHAVLVLDGGEWGAWSFNGSLAYATTAAAQARKVWKHVHIAPVTDTPPAPAAKPVSKAQQVVLDDFARPEVVRAASALQWRAMQGRMNHVLTYTLDGKPATMCGRRWQGEPTEDDLLPRCGRCMSEISKSTPNAAKAADKEATMARKTTTKQDGPKATQARAQREAKATKATEATPAEQAEESPAVTPNSVVVKQGTGTGKGKGRKATPKAEAAPEPTTETAEVPPVEQLPAKDSSALDLEGELLTQLRAKVDGEVDVREAPKTGAYTTLRVDGKVIGWTFRQKRGLVAEAKGGAKLKVTGAAEVEQAVEQLAAAIK